MTELLVVAVAIFVYAMFSERLAMSPLTPPIVFTAVGLVAGSAGLDLFDLGLDNEATSILVEATLVLVLFTDAIRIDLSTLRQDAQLPGRLLGVGMPLTIALGTLVGAVLLGELGAVEAALLAAVLAPTDAALGQAVVSDTRLPVRVRQTLNVESGLNDGIAVPVVTVLLAAVAAEGAGAAGDWVELAARQVGFGLLAGLAAGLCGGVLMDRRAAAGRVEGIYQQLGTIAIAVAAFAGAELLDGNGFIAAFTAGLSFGHIARSQCAGIQDFTEDEGELLSTITFVLFGAVVLGPHIDDLTWQIGAYAVLSLTAIRIVPVVLSLFGAGLLWETRLFFGWFGPRGLASILFALVVVEELETPAGELIFTTVAWTVALSIVAHGLTAGAWAGHLAGRIGRETEPMPETDPSPTLSTLSTRRRLER